MSTRVYVNELVNGFLVEDYRTGAQTYCKNVAQVLKAVKAELTKERPEEEEEDKIPF